MSTLWDVSETVQPTPDPLPESLVESHKYSCVMGALPSDLSAGIHQLRQHVAPQDVMEDAGNPHVTVLYGLHTSDPQVIYQHLKKNQAIRPPTIHLGPLSLFRNRDQDILKVDVDSQDLRHLNHVLRQLPTTQTYTDYRPHVTVAYLRAGAGDKYLGLPNHLQGREVTLGGVVFSTPEKHQHFLPLRAPRVEDIVELATSWGFSESELVEMTTAMSVGTQQRPFGYVRPILPSKRGLKKPAVGSVEARAKGWCGKFSELKEGLQEAEYTGLPYHVQIGDFIEGDGWHVAAESHHVTSYNHEMRPGVLLQVRKFDAHPVWSLTSRKGSFQGSSIDDLKGILKKHPLEHVDHDDEKH